MNKDSDEIIGIGHFKIDKANLDEYKRLCEQAMQITLAQDPGTLQYDLFFNADGSECVFIERFKDSASLQAHIANLGDLFGAIVDKVTVVHGAVLGQASPELRAVLADGPVKHFSLHQSMETP
jgi:quinol monooxygenase YgiN